MEKIGIDESYEKSENISVDNMKNSYDFEENENKTENASKEDNELRNKPKNQRKNCEIRKIQTVLKYHS